MSQELLDKITEGLEQAHIRALKTAIIYGTSMIYYKDGAIIELNPYTVLNDTISRKVAVPF